MEEAVLRVIEQGQREVAHEAPQGKDEEPRPERWLLRVLAPEQQDEEADAHVRHRRDERRRVDEVVEGLRREETALEMEHHSDDPDGDGAPPRDDVEQRNDAVTRSERAWQEQQRGHGGEHNGRPLDGPRKFVRQMRRADVHAEKPDVGDRKDVGRAQWCHAREELHRFSFLAALSSDAVRSSSARSRRSS